MTQQPAPATIAPRIVVGICWINSWFLRDLRAFTGRPAGIASHVAAHAVNPALQPTLSRIPCATLAESYRRARGYDYGVISLELE